MGIFSPLKSSSLLRYTLMHTAVMTLLCLLIIGIVSKYSIGYYRQHKDLFIFQTLATLKSFSETESRFEFIDNLKRIAGDNRNSLVVLKNRQGYFGNLNYLPASIPETPLIGDFLVWDDSAGVEERLQNVRGSRIATRWGDVLVGYNAPDFNLFASRFQLALYSSMLLALLAASLVSFLFARKLLNRLAHVNRITSEVRKGKLSARVPVGTKNDEFDELANSINSMLDQIESGMEGIASVTDNIAHDLRTPLSRLRIRMDGHIAKGSAGVEELLVLRGEVDRILTTFNAMLELSRLEQGARRVAFGPCNISGLCEEVIELAIPLAECNDQQLQLELKGTFILEGNRELLFRALYNLVENAIKYSPDGGTIQMVVYSNKVCIHDQGPGIPVDEQEKVFRRLYRLDRSRKEDGFGLGLSLVRAVAHMHGLTVTLENKDGFSVCLCAP